MKTIRSVVDTQSDRSSYWREVENWNIAMSMREHAAHRAGARGRVHRDHGQRRHRAEAYREYREWPHNTFLGILLLLGLFGFTAVFGRRGGDLPGGPLLPAVDGAGAPGGRAGELVIILCSLVLAWGDLGSAFPQYNVLVALAVSGVALLAPAVGAWPTESHLRVPRDHRTT